MLWANAPSLDMLAQKIDDMLWAKSKKYFDFELLKKKKNFLSDCDRTFRKATYVLLS